jgi:ferredoxin
MSLKSRILVGLAKTGFNRRFLMAKMSRIEPIGGFIDKMLFDEDRMIYLPKDSAVERTSEKSVIVRMDKPIQHTNTVLPSRILEHFIRSSRYHFDCKDYPKHYGCLFLGRGALKIDKKYGKLVTAEEALEHMRKCREAGLVHLIGRNKIDAVVFDTGDKEDLLSICNCCPCCCLWKMLPDLSADIGSGVTRMPGVVVSVTEGCVGCGECVDKKICFVDAIKLCDGKAVVDQERCRGCGRCTESCPHDAIELRIDDMAYFEKSVRTIEPLVDIKSE